MATALPPAIPLTGMALYSYYRVNKLRTEERLAAIARGVNVPMEPELSQAARSRRAGILLVAAALGYATTFALIARVEPDAWVAACAVETIQGKVWHVNPPTYVFLRMGDGSNQRFEIPKGQKFNVEGRMVDAWGLKPGMKITATKVVEFTATEIEQQRKLTGSMPPPPAAPCGRCSYSDC